jgi:hypothetical protein
MRSTITQSVGVDISRDALDVAVHPAGESFRIANNPEGHRALIKRLKGFDNMRASGALMSYVRPTPFTCKATSGATTTRCATRLKSMGGRWRIVDGREPRSIGRRRT